MDERLKENLQRSTTWIRAAYMLLFLVIIHVAQFVIFSVILFQLGLLLMTGSTNENLRGFGRKLARYVEQVVAYLTYASEERPYPFSPWPRALEEID
jgi:hypothetical protein